MQFKWNYEPLTSDQRQAAEELGEKIGMNPILAAMLIRRGITTESAAKRFFRPQLSDLINPFLMKDMDIAVDRLNDAMGRKERILVYGDYDVDGCTAVALVYKFLQQFYSNIDYYIPDRYDEGYGVSNKGIEYARETGVKLIIILDCGIKAVKQIAYAKTLGIDFIICDHHVPDEEMPPAVAILNPKRPDDTFPFKDLCGCGVGFKFMQAFAKNNGIPFSRLIPLLDFCAVSIAADLVSVTEENRILAFHGLKQLNINPSIGLKAIIDICGLNGRELSMSDIIFKIGPRINASGRMESGKESVDLLIEPATGTTAPSCPHPPNDLSAVVYLPHRARARKPSPPYSHLFSVSVSLQSQPTTLPTAGRAAAWLHASAHVTAVSSMHPPHEPRTHSHNTADYRSHIP